MNQLEGSRIFPHIAWILIVGFAIFTWTLTMHLKSEMSKISSNIEISNTDLQQIQKQKIRNRINSLE